MVKVRGDPCPKSVWPYKHQNFSIKFFNYRRSWHSRRLTWPHQKVSPQIFYCQEQNWKWSDFFYRNAEPSRMCLVLHVWLCKPPTSIWEAHVWILLKPWKFCLFSPHAVAQVSGNLWGSFIYFICLHRSNEIYFCKKLCKAWNS